MTRPGDLYVLAIDSCFFTAPGPLPASSGVRCLRGETFVIIDAVDGDLLALRAGHMGMCWLACTSHGHRGVLSSSFLRTCMRLVSRAPHG